MKKDKVITFCFAFILPILLVLPAFASVGIYPFGSQSLLIVDMHSEYIDYLAQLNNTIHFSGSLLRSWNMGMGLNMLGLIAFYAASPLNLIAMLMPISAITEAVFVMTLLKLGLAGLFFAIFARETFPEAGRSLHVVFSAAYALMGYNIAYSSNIMWLDGTAFLPLVLLGTERILRRGRYRTFLLSLIYVFFTSYYIGYMIGVFAFLYFTASYFSNRNSFREYAHILARFIGSAALAAGCCAVLLLPAFLNLKDGQNEMWNIMSGMNLRYPAVRLASKLLPAVYDSLTDSGLPNIFCSVFAVMLCLLYFCTKAVPRREKFVFGGLLSFLILSLSCELLDLAWHAFEDPTWFPARYSFVFSFLVLFLALRCACLLGEVTKRAILASAIILAVLFVEIAVNRYRFMSLKNVYMAISLVIIYAVILLLWKNGKRHVLTAFIIVYVCMECFGHAAFTVMGMDEQFGYRNRDDYRSFMESYNMAAGRVKALDTGVYRTEILGARNANGAMALGYNGISHYSTTTDQKLNGFLRSLGYNTGTINELRFSESTPLTNGLLGIKYVLSEKELDGAYKLVDKLEGIGIYENSAAFPLAFWTPQAVLDFKYESGNPFQIQNKFVSALTGELMEPFSTIVPEEPRLDNVQRLDFEDHIEYERLIRNQIASVEYTVENSQKHEIYAFFPVYDGKFSSSEVLVNGELAGRDLAYRSNTIIRLGEDESATVTIMPEGERVRISVEYFATLDIETAKKAAAYAAENQMQFTKFRDTVVEGTITAPDDGVIATTFPFDSGWSVKVDGKKVRTENLAGVFLAIPVSAGEHTITMRYLPSGFVTGLIITVISVASMLIFFFVKRDTNTKH